METCVCSSTSGAQLGRLAGWGKAASRPEASPPTRLVAGACSRLGPRPGRRRARPRGVSPHGLARASEQCGRCSRVKCLQESEVEERGVCTAQARKTLSVACACAHSGGQGGRGGPPGPGRGCQGQTVRGARGMRAVIGAVFAKCDLSINRAPGNLIPFVFIKTDLPSAWSVPGTVLEALLTLPLGSLKASSRQVERCHREKQRGWESP